MPPFNHFTTKAKEVIRKAHELAIERGQNQVNSLHLMTALTLQEESIIFSGMVLSSEFLGQFTRYHLKAGDVDLVVDHPHRIGLKPFAENASVSLALKLSEVKLF